MDWIKAHPELVFMIVTGVVTFVFKPRTPEQYEAMPKWLADTFRFIAAIGIDPVKAAKVISDAVSGKKFPPPSDQ